jgi:hypothetical protein
MLDKIRSFNSLVDLIENFSEDIDLEYIKSVEYGDVETQVKMVDDMAKKMGYNSPIVYRGDKKGKKQFTGREDPSNYIQGNIFFSSKKEIGLFYTRRHNVLYSAYLQLENSLVINAKGKDWSSIPIPNKLGGKKEFPYGLQIDDLAELANKEGYGSLIVLDVMDQAGYGDQYVVFEPSKIKSADPITYDDNGNIIPLSKRFNPKSNDIRE